MPCFLHSGQGVARIRITAMKGEELLLAKARAIAKIEYNGWIYRTFMFDQTLAMTRLPGRIE
ncbi:MAG: hypothetical protein HQL73_08650 [Magnetococcales bacterium]|nr:hypothetical protein [Magnetococcales bacterium]